MARNVGKSRPMKNNDSNRWEDYLDSGEKLLWQGAPGTGFRFTVMGLLLSVFGVFFLGFAVFWIYLTANLGDGLVFSILGVPFLLVGLWLVAGHWFLDVYRRKHARYALTNKRALIARTSFGRRMESYPIDASSDIQLVSGALDTVYFAQNIFRGKNGTTTVNIGFRYIPDGQVVFNLLREVKGENS